MPGLAGVDQGQQFTGGSGIRELVDGAGSQRLGPAQVVAADLEGADEGQRNASVPQRVGRLAADRPAERGEHAAQRSRG